MFAHPDFAKATVDRFRRHRPRVLDPRPGREARVPDELTYVPGAFDELIAGRRERAQGRPRSDLRQLHRGQAEHEAASGDRGAVSEARHPPTSSSSSSTRRTAAPTSNFAAGLVPRNLSRRRRSCARRSTWACRGGTRDFCSRATLPLLPLHGLPRSGLRDPCEVRDYSSASPPAWAPGFQERRRRRRARHRGPCEDGEVRKAARSTTAGEGIWKRVPCAGRQRRPGARRRSSEAAKAAR